MKAFMTNFDINAVITELTQRLRGSELKNIFEYNDIFFFRFRTKQEGTQVLVVEPGKRMHITKFKRSFPPEPSGLCKVFRIHIKGKWLKNIYQYDFDRICVLEFEADEKVYTLIIELFGKGNLILLSPESKILVAKNYKKMRDRDVHPGIEFQFPPTTGQNFMEAQIDWIKEQLNTHQELDAQSALSKMVNINKDYATEICLIAGVDPQIKISDLDEEKINQLLNGIKSLRNIFLKGELAPTVIYSKDSDEIFDIVPFPMKIYSDFRSESVDSFSDKLDEWFSSIETGKETAGELSVEKQRVQQLIEVRRKQEEHLTSLKQSAEEDKVMGNLIYMYLQEIDELIQTITNARRKNISWYEIKEKLTKARDKNMKSARLLDSIQENNKTITLNLDGNKIVLDFLKSATENANDMYKRAKKSEGKMPGAKSKINELNERIGKLEAGYHELVQKERIMIEKRSREWYEKFHWFKSSDGFLIIAGKDQKTNELIVKKYLETNDLFLHAEVHGAAVVVIKGEGKQIPKSTIEEAAVFSVCYSKAWKDGSSSENTFWVTPDQVSFSAPSGEYLAKGSFVIKGTKNQITNVPLEIAVTPIIEEKNAFIIAGPYSAISTNDKVLKKKIIRVIPGDVSKSNVAKKIVSLFIKDLDEIDQTKINATALNDLISILPGDCYIKE